MQTLWSIIVSVFWSLLSVVWWLAVKLFWLLAWFVLPFLVLAFVALRAAEYLLGKAVVQAWVKRQSLKLGRGTWRRVHTALFALGSLPLRVLFWLVVYTLWHSVLSLLWTPRWKPWARAWGRRWRRKAEKGA